MRQRVSENHGFEVPMVGSDTMYKQHSEDNTCLPADAGADERRCLNLGRSMVLVRSGAGWVKIVV